MNSDEEEKPINLRRHRQYGFISPRYIFRILLTVVAMGFLIYMAFDLFETRQQINQNKIPSKDSTNNEIQVEIDTLK